MKRSKGGRRVKVSADGSGWSRMPGSGLLRELAVEIGLVDGVTAALLDTYDGVPIHRPGRVFCDLAVAVADGADAISGISVLADRSELFGAVASMPTTWRVLNRVDPQHLAGVARARSDARARAWVAGAAPDLGQELRLDFDASVVIAHSEKENAAATWKRSSGSTRCWVFWTARTSPVGRRWPGCCGRANTGSNTAADHVTVLDQALAAPGLELRHRQHAWVEDRIGEARATGMRSLPCRGFADNAAWLQVVLTAVDLTLLDQADLLRPDHGAGPLQDRHLPLPRAARGRPPDHHRPPAVPARRQDLSVGQIAAGFHQLWTVLG